MVDRVDPRAFEYVLTKIEDGFIFEKFACQFLSCVLSYNFIPVGGLKDRGIDGLEHLYHREGFERYIYQVSIEKNPTEKLKQTLAVLQKNKIYYDRLVFVTNQIFSSIDRIVDNFYDQYKKQITIYDRKWFSLQVNNSQCTIITYTTFLSHYLHEYQTPTKSYIIDDLVGDPRLFIFLRQQWDLNQELRKEIALLWPT